MALIPTARSMGAPAEPASIVAAPSLAPPSSWNSGITEGGVKDVWVDTSEDDEDYRQAHRALSRAKKHATSEYAQAVAIVGAAADTKGKKRQTAKVH
jgi:hypothetical protein